MLKVIIISLVIFYVVYKLTGFFFRMLIRSTINNAHQERSGSGSQYRKKPSDGNVNIDFIPKEKGEKKDQDYNGGEYIDYEEVK